MFIYHPQTPVASQTPNLQESQHLNPTAPSQEDPSSYWQENLLTVDPQDGQIQAAYEPQTYEPAYDPNAQPTYPPTSYDAPQIVDPYESPSYRTYESDETYVAGQTASDPYAPTIDEYQSPNLNYDQQTQTTTESQIYLSPSAYEYPSPESQGHSSAPYEAEASSPIYLAQTNPHDTNVQPSPTVNNYQSHTTNHDSPAPSQFTIQDAFSPKIDTNPTHDYPQPPSQATVTFHNPPSPQYESQPRSFDPVPSKSQNGYQYQSTSYSSPSNQATHEWLQSRTSSNSNNPAHNPPPPYEYDAQPRTFHKPRVSANPSHHHIQSLTNQPRSSPETHTQMNYDPRRQLTDDAAPSQNPKQPVSYSYQSNSFDHLKQPIFDHFSPRY